jgi:transposase
MTRKAALFAGSDGGTCYWAIATTLTQTAKLNGVEPTTWLTDVPLNADRPNPRSRSSDPPSRRRNPYWQDGCLGTAAGARSC